MFFLAEKLPNDIINFHFLALGSKSLLIPAIGLAYSYIKDVVTPYTHISEASRYILYTIILTFDGICMLS